MCIFEFSISHNMNINHSSVRNGGIEEYESKNL